MAKDYLPCDDFSFDKEELYVNEVHFEIRNIEFTENKFGSTTYFEGLIIVKAVSWVSILLEDITVQNSD